MKIGFEKVCIDANVLIYATFPDFENDKHKKSLETLDFLTASDKSLFITPQVLREFFAISTNSMIFKKPLTRIQAVKKIKEFLDCFNLACETETTVLTLLKLIEKHHVLRQKVHDMNIVATMLDNGIFHLITFNVADFKNINEISVIEI